MSVWTVQQTPFIAITLQLREEDGTALNWKHASSENSSTYANDRLSQGVDNVFEYCLAIVLSDERQALCNIVH